ncbi:DUF6338 family protein [Shewanella sp. SM43]|uniref:DUF6338 family protein n=1 Tax=Shewanella sp. SM43 TaxID=2912798 RepID=UPI0021D9416B|nr:DUF6338 family protein [Shewanella sp. SM43]MCU8051456.1 DUF6338 family protein [Shewanella sp. SM43]
MPIWELDKLYIFIIFVIPGFVTLKSYELMCPTAEFKDSSKQVIDAVSFSCINYALLSLFILGVEKSDLRTSCFFAYVIFYLFVLFVFPIIVAFLWRKIRQTDWFLKHAPHPTLKPWDFVFSQRKFLFVKVFLKDKTVIAGYYGEKSFTSSAPAPEQIYLEQTWVLTNGGGFERPKNQSAGVIILSSEISYIEFKTVNGV